MPAPVCSDQEFIELFKTHGSVAVVARTLGLAEQKIRSRRRRLEVKYNIRLEGHAQPARSRHYSNLSPTEYKANHHLGLLNGQVIVFSDAHFIPQVRTVANKGLLKLIRELKPRAVICGGDAFDGASISRHPRIGWEHRTTVIEELRACKDRLSEIAEAAGRAKLVWTLGNHDSRFSSRLAANAPEFAGVHGFQLKDHFPEWIPAWACWVNDSSVVKHRYKGGVHATHNNTVNAGVNIVTGHLHQLKVTPFADYTGNRYGVDAGTLAEPMGPQFINYTESGPLNWRSGFVVLTFKDGRMLLPQIAQKWDESHIEFGGSLINVSKE